MLAMRAVLCTAAATAVAVAVGKVEAVAHIKSDVGDSTDEAVEAPTRTVAAPSRLLVAMKAAPKPPGKVPRG